MFVALVSIMQWACDVLSSVASLVLQHCSTLSHKRHNFSEVFIILSKPQRDIIKIIHSTSFKTPVYSCQILMKHEFSRQILEKSWNLKFNKNPSIGSRVVQCGLTDGQTDTIKLIIYFREIAKSSNKTTKTAVKFVTMRINSINHCGVVRLW